MLGSHDREMPGADVVLLPLGSWLLNPGVTLTQITRWELAGSGLGGLWALEKAEALRGLEGMVGVEP